MESDGGFVGAIMVKMSMGATMLGNLDQLYIVQLLETLDSPCVHSN